MEIFEVSKEFRFEAAHSLPHLPADHKCSNIHGHSYKVEVICRGELDHRGFVIDYAEISAATKPLIDTLDHRNLNDILPYYTTAENLAKWFYEQLASINPYQVKVYETPTTCCTYPIR